MASVVRFFPTWLPGAGYLRKLEAGKALTHSAFVTPVELVKSEIVRVSIGPLSNRRFPRLAYDAP